MVKLTYGDKYFLNKNKGVDNQIETKKMCY